MSNARNCWRAVVLVSTLLGACGPTVEGPGEEEVGLAEQESLTGVSLGLVTGDFYVNGPQPLSTHAEQVFCEFSNLGAKWIRIEADSPGVDTDTYRRIVEKARAKGIKVNVLVPARYCGADGTQSEVDAFTSSYVSHLADLATNVFVGSAQADAFEIGSEPNVVEQGCGDGVERARVGPNAFAWLLRRVWEWKTANARPELIVSGGMLNTYTYEPYWSSFFGSAAFTGYPGSRPFDYFGIHPYNYASLDKACIQTGSSACFATWKNNVISGLKAVAAQVNSATGTTGAQLFATEFGFQLSSVTTCASKACVNNIYQQSAGFHAAGEALVSSGVTPLGLWAAYRDSQTEYFGLRADWDGSKYVTRTLVWNKFRSLAGGTGSTIPDACWAKGIYVPLDFEFGDARRTTVTGEWAHASYKAECAPGERVMGVSASIASGWARSALCYKDPLDAGRYEHVVCTARNVETGSNRGRTSTGDWDPNHYLGECAANEYVAGVAQSTSNQLTHVLCCAIKTSLSATSCEARVFAGADNRETTDSGNWDASGFKGECGVGRYVAGVSRTPAGDPHALLCCAQ